MLHHANLLERQAFGYHGSHMVVKGTRFMRVNIAPRCYRIDEQTKHTVSYLLHESKKKRNVFSY